MFSILFFLKNTGFFLEIDQDTVWNWRWWRNDGMFCYEFTINVNFCVLDQKGTDQFWSEILLLTSLNFHLLPNLVSVFSSLITPLRHSLSPLSIYSYPSPSSPLPLPTPFPNSNLSLGTLFVRVVSDVLNGKKTE